MNTLFELVESTAETATGLRNVPLQTSIQNGVLILAIGVDTLTWASSPENGGPLDGVKKINADIFAKDVCAEMMLEHGGFNEAPEAGKWLDCMIQNAADRGSAALEWGKKGRDF